MIIFQIDYIMNHKIRLRDLRSNKIYDLFISFFGIKHQPENGDFLILANRFFDSASEEYLASLCFSADLHDKCGRDFEHMRIEEGDIAILICKKDNFVLKRLYG